MRLDDLLDSLTRRVYRAIPDDAPDRPPHDPLDATFAAKKDDNRWNVRGQPTLYLAGDARSLYAEWARYVDEQALDPVFATAAGPKRIWAMTVNVELVADLRRPDLCAALQLPDPPFGFMRNRTACQEVAGRLRRETVARDILAPSMALLDQPEHWILALFVDRLPSYPDPFLTDVERLGLMPDLS